MAASAEHIAVKRERAGLLWHEAKGGHLFRRDVGAEIETVAFESVESVEGREFEHRGGVRGA